MRNTGPARFFVPLGLVLIIFGVVLFVFRSDNYLEATGMVTAVTEDGIPADGEDQMYNNDITYTVDGKQYQTTFSLHKAHQVGDSITVYYDPENPQTTTNAKTGPLLAIIVIALGGASLAGGIWMTVKAFKKSKALGAIKDFPNELFTGIKTAPGVTEYYFRFDGHSFKPGYIVEDAARHVLFEGTMVKQAVVGARRYEFHNHVSGNVTPHEIGHTVTQSYNNEVFSAKSWFKFDGKNIWDLLHDKGIRLVTDVHSNFPYMMYNAALNGKAFAHIECCSQYVHEDDEAQHAVKVPTGNRFYRFWTDSNDFDLLFLTIFAISETEQLIVE